MCICLHCSYKKSCNCVLHAAVSCQPWSCTLMCLQDCVCADLTSVNILHTFFLCWVAYAWNVATRKYCTCVLPAAVSCGTAPDVPANGQRNGSGTTYGSTVTYTCNPGYTLKGGSKLTCMANGQWSGRTPTCSRKLLCNQVFHYR